MKFTYGNLSTDYDLKEDKFGDFEITYSDLLEDYKLEIGYFWRGKRERTDF